MYNMCSKYYSTDEEDLFQKIKIYVKLSQEEIRDMFIEF